MTLPESLARVPNIPIRKQTLEQLRAERAHWQAKIDERKSWGASVGAALGFRDECDRWIKRREAQS